MGSIKDEDVRGCWIGKTLICKDCIDKRVQLKGEVEGIEKENIHTESDMDEGADYICIRCKRRI
jgi:hypothetical protein